MPQSRIKFHIKDKGVLKKDQELFKKDNRLFLKEQELFFKMSCSFLPLPRIRKLSFRGSFPFHAHFLRGKGLKTPYFIPGRNCL
jgi:conserved domain protein